MAKFRRREIGLALATALAAVALGVLWGIAAAIALIDTTRRSSSPMPQIWLHEPWVRSMKRIHPRAGSSSTPKPTSIWT
jgi:hypothetical protein